MRVCLLPLCTLIATSFGYYVGLGTFLGTSGYGQYTTANFGGR